MDAKYPIINSVKLNTWKEVPWLWYERLINQQGFLINQQEREREKENLIKKKKETEKSTFI